MCEPGVFAAIARGGQPAEARAIASAGRLVREAKSSRLYFPAPFLASPFWERNLAKRFHEHLGNNKEVNKKVKLPVGIFVVT
jgi:hypothetical protein